MPPDQVTKVLILALFAVLLVSPLLVFVYRVVSQDEFNEHPGNGDPAHNVPENDAKDLVREPYGDEQSITHDQ